MAFGSFTGDPANNPVDRIRLIVADTSPDFDFLANETYNYLLEKHNNNEGASAREAARYILASLAHHARERTGDIEVYGSEFFKNYRAYLLDTINNPNMGGVNARPYAGGVSKQDMLRNDCYPDNVRPPNPNREDESGYDGFSKG